MAFGELGLGAAEFGEMTFRDFMRRVRAHRRRQQAQQAQRLDDWRQTRWLGTVLLNLHRAPDEPALTPEEVMPLPGDPAPEPVDADAFDAEVARLATLDPDWQ